METLKKINLKCETQGDFAKDTCEWIKEMRTKYADIENNEKMILEIVQGYFQELQKCIQKRR